MWDDLNSNPWQVGNRLANWVDRLCRSWSWLQQWIGQCHRKPRKRSRSWSCRLIHRRSWDQNNGWRCTSRCILMIWFRFQCSWSTQSHPPLTQLLLLLSKPLQTSGAMAVSSWGWRHSPGFRSPCRQPAVSFRLLPRQKYCSRQSLGERSMRQTMTQYIFKKAQAGGFESSTPLSSGPLFILNLAIPMQHDPVWVNRDRRPGPLTSTSLSWHAAAKRLCYWASSAILAWSEGCLLLADWMRLFFLNAFAIRVCFRDTKNTKATILWMVWRDTVRRTLG